MAALTLTSKPYICTLCGLARQRYVVRPSKRAIHQKKKRVENPNLPSTVTTVDTSWGCEGYLVGTEHFSKESQEDVVKAKQIPGCKLVLDDCLSKETLSRAFSLVTLWQKMKFSSYLLKDRVFTVFSKKDIEKAKKGEYSEEFDKNFSVVFSGFINAFGNERDGFLAHSLKESAVPLPHHTMAEDFIPSLAAGVGGIAHDPSIKKNGENLKNDEEKDAKIKKSFKPKQNSQVKWQPVIGLEVHAQIQADGKLFSGASSKYGAPVNTQVSFLDSALPGTLPVLNRRCVEAAVLTALALKCRINKISRFDRKHYFYADLPAGYQITQQNHAIANDGTFQYIEFGEREEDCVEKSARILQLQLEQDSGKSLHDEYEERSLIDLNRAGIALMEIVTAPDFHSGNEARSFVRDLRLLLVTLGTCNGKFSEGSIRVDANISVHRPGEPLGTRSEVKNINSVKCLKKAIDFEIERQIELLEKGEEVVNETRSFDKDTGKTLSMRDKESKQDYRFMPEPNLPPLHLYSYDDVNTGSHDDVTSASRVIIDKVKNELPALPNEIRDNLMSKYGLNLYKANFILTAEAVDLYENLVASRDINKFTSFLINHFLNVLLERDSTPSESGISSESVGNLYDWYINEDLSLSNVQKIIRSLLDGESSDPKSLADKWNVWQINDEEYLTDICKQIIQENPSLVAKVKKGKKRALNKLMGDARTMTSDRGNLTKMSKIFKKLIQD